ncbi:MAG: hypothetical protein WKF73_19040 [Nocardioidaceae bacterium]
MARIDVNQQVQVAVLIGRAAGHRPEDPDVPYTEALTRAHDLVAVSPHVIEAHRTAWRFQLHGLGLPDPLVGCYPGRDQDSAQAGPPRGPTAGVPVAENWWCRCRRAPEVPLRVAGTSRSWPFRPR